MMEDGFLSLVEEQSKAYNIRHRCFYFSKDVISFIRNAQYDRIFFSLFDQLLRSATSIGANVVEGSAGSTRKDFVNYYSVALKSANETKYWLCVMRDSLNLDVTDLLNEADELSKIIASIIIAAKS